MSSGSAQITRYGVETVIGTPPAAWQTLAFVTNGLDDTPTTTESQSIRDSRISAGTLVTGSDKAGDIETEFVFGVQDPLLECVAFNAWGNNVLTFGGKTRKTISIVKGYTDINNYHLFAGCHANTWTLTIPEDGIVTSAFGFIGKTRTPSAIPPTGTVTPAPKAVQFTSISVGDIEFDNATVAGQMCVTALSLTIDNSMQVQKCLNYTDNVGAVLEAIMVGSGSATLAWSVRAAQLYEKQFTNTPVKIEWSIKDNLGNVYIIELPRVLLSMTLPSGGSGDILTVEANFTIAEGAPIITRIPVVITP